MKRIKLILAVIAIVALTGSLILSCGGGGDDGGTSGGGSTVNVSGKKPSGTGNPPISGGPNRPDELRYVNISAPSQVLLISTVAGLKEAIINIDVLGATKVTWTLSDTSIVKFKGTDEKSLDSTWLILDDPKNDNKTIEYVKASNDPVYLTLVPENPTSGYTIEPGYSVKIEILAFDNLTINGITAGSIPSGPYYNTDSIYPSSGIRDLLNFVWNDVTVKVDTVQKGVLELKLNSNLFYIEEKNNAALSYPGNTIVVYENIGSKATSFPVAVSYDTVNKLELSTQPLPLLAGLIDDGSNTLELAKYKIPVSTADEAADYALDDDKNWISVFATWDNPRRDDNATIFFGFEPFEFTSPAPILTASFPATTKGNAKDVGTFYTPIESATFPAAYANTAGTKTYSQNVSYGASYSTGGPGSSTTDLSFRVVAPSNVVITPTSTTSFVKLGTLSTTLTGDTAINAALKTLFGSPSTTLWQANVAYSGDFPANYITSFNISTSVTVLSGYFTAPDGSQWYNKDGTKFIGDDGKDGTQGTAIYWFGGQPSNSVTFLVDK